LEEVSTIFLRPFQIWLISEHMANCGRLAFSDLCVNTMAVIVTFSKNQRQAELAKFNKFWRIVEVLSSLKILFYVCL